MKLNDRFACMTKFLFCTESLILKVQADPRYYPNPDTFNPDNFSKESRSKRSP
jgi:hypothetical protein